MDPASPPVDQECVEAYVFRRSPLELLIFRRPPARGRIWVPVSGRVEPGDKDFRAAAARELHEETGQGSVRAWSDLEWAVTFDGPDGRRWRLHAFAAEVARGWDPSLSPEHDAFEWVSVEEAVRRLHYPDNRDAVRRLVDRVRPAGPTV